MLSIKIILKIKSSAPFKEVQLTSEKVFCN